MANTSLYIPTLVKRGKFIDYRDPIWGDSYNWSWNRQPNEVKYLVIHHTVTSHDATPDDIALLHKARGWGGIGYHFVITKDGTVYYVGDVGTARANVLNMNEKVIGISLIGDFTKHLPSDAQIKSAHELCEFFLTAGVWENLKSWDNVVGHKELQATQCPGNDWKDTSSALYNRIKDNIPYTPEPTPEPPANEDECVKMLEKCNTELKSLNKTLDEATTTLKKANKTINEQQAIIDNYKKFEDVAKANIETQRLAIKWLSHVQKTYNEYGTAQLIGLAISRWRNTPEIQELQKYADLSMTIAQTPDLVKEKIEKGEVI